MQNHVQVAFKNSKQQPSIARVAIQSYFNDFCFHILILIFRVKNLLLALIEKGFQLEKDKKTPVFLPLYNSVLYFLLLADGNPRHDLLAHF